MDADITRQAVDKAGGVVALARQLGVTKGAVSQWERVPARHVLEVEQLSGVSRHQLRPDVFGPEPQTA
jgi:DNA-binding transcriptional regulator YdaS (Cro superfamily)